MARSCIICGAQGILCIVTPVRWECKRCRILGDKRRLKAQQPGHEQKRLRFGRWSQKAYKRFNWE